MKIPELPYSKLTKEQQRFVRWWIALGLPMKFRYDPPGPGKSRWNKSITPGDWLKHWQQKPTTYDHLIFKLGNHEP